MNLYSIIVFVIAALFDAQLKFCKMFTDKVFYI